MTLNIERLAPPKRPNEHIDNRECKGRDFQLGHGEVLMNTSKALHAKPQPLTER
jgi:hypothetical protein